MSPASTHGHAPHSPVAPTLHASDTPAHALQGVLNFEAAHPLKSGVVRVLIADDHRIVREGLRRILQGSAGVEIVGEAEDGHQALQLMQQHPDVAVVDLSMPGLSGMNLIKRLKHDYPDTAVLVLTMHGEEQYAMRAFRSGATGYLTKDSAAEELVKAVRRVADGKAYLSPAMAERVATSLHVQVDAPRHTTLTDREYEVFRLIVKGLRLTEIGERLHLSVKTVSTHKSRILEKMHLDSTAALIRYGVQNRLFTDDEALAF